METCVCTKRKRRDHNMIYTHNCTNMLIVHQLNLENTINIWGGTAYCLQAPKWTLFSVGRQNKVWVDSISNFEFWYYNEPHHGRDGPKYVFFSDLSWLIRLWLREASACLGDKSINDYSILFYFGFLTSSIVLVI